MLPTLLSEEIYDANYMDYSQGIDKLAQCYWVQQATACSVQETGQVCVKSCSQGRNWGEGGGQGGASPAPLPRTCKVYYNSSVLLSEFQFQSSKLDVRICQDRSPTSKFQFQLWIEVRCYRELKCEGIGDLGAEKINVIMIDTNSSPPPPPPPLP